MFRKKYLIILNKFIQVLKNKFYALTLVSCMANIQRCMDTRALALYNISLDAFK